MRLLILKIQTALSLGIVNLVRVLIYQSGIKLGLHPVQHIKAKLPKGNCFFFPALCGDNAQEKTKTSLLRYFGWYRIEYASPPDWHKNPFSGRRINGSKYPWWKIPDFDINLGDIKTIWEASRLDWTLDFARQSTQRDPNMLNVLNLWLTDWCQHNPAYYGPNWKCSQEASIRIMHLAYAALILKQHLQPSDSVVQFVEVHLLRIVPTIQYAIAQNNNHGTSEAAALFIGGSWLSSLGFSDAKKWESLGRKWLENHASHLIEADGSFSQYSVNYHRVMLDTYSMVEHWRNTFGLPVFSAHLYQKLISATYWLYQMVQQKNGHTPNLGANDGACLLPLENIDSQDFRPSVQLAMTLFCKKDAYGKKGEWNRLLDDLAILAPDDRTYPKKSVQFPDGGYSTLQQDKAFLLFRFPNFRFRPSQADALHVDLWLDGENLLRDGGTYSYSAEQKTMYYFSGTASHNTIQFDDRDQMPRLGRFLFAKWLKTQNEIPISLIDNQLRTSACYHDYKGATHFREIELTPDHLQVNDIVSGFNNKAVLRWQLKSGDWTIANRAISNGKHSLHIQTELKIIRFEIVEGYESRYYLRKTPLPVLEVEVSTPGKITTFYNFHP